VFDVPETRYAQSGELTIAYQVFGNGPIDLVFVPGFVSHCDLMWDVPPFRSLLDALGRFARVVTFDKRGTGLSDRSLGFGTVEDRMDDIRAVMDAAGLERAALMGISEGGPLAIAFAATYPERTDALVLLGTFARVKRCEGYEIGIDPALADPFPDATRELWGTGSALPIFISGLADTPEARRALARYERSATTPPMAAEILRANIEIDVRAALPAVSAPTLVLHHDGDVIAPPALGRYLADHIEGAHYVERAAPYHIGPATPELVDLAAEFLTGARPSPVVDRILATVLFTDIVDSTRRAADLGDRRWRSLLDDFRGSVRRELDRHRGREVNTRGDDFLATFDGPGRAIRCAQAVGAAARGLGLETRAGLHTGELELTDDDDVAGLAVHIGARVCSLAGAGEVLVTSTVRDLVVGSGIAFEPRGSHELKGVPGEWSVLAVQE
jgi:pimeloyl-ACP methyl ester carboxylesterase